MDQERFDKIAQAVSRRRILGGSVAGLLGVATAKISGADAKKKGKAKRKKSRASAEALCFPGACPFGSCCSDTPAGNLTVGCTPITAQTSGPVGGLCGNATGSGDCRTCPAGTRCSLVAGGLRCVATPQTCPNGCIIPRGARNGIDDLCVPNGNGAPVNSSDGFFDGRFVCGTGGSVCNPCSTGGLVGGVFSGCCSATGACAAGTANSDCGSSGRLCQACNTAAGSNCGVQQACTAPTTVTPVPPPPPPPPAPSTGCGPGTANPCTNGCCAETSPGVFRCESGGAKNACGKGGIICQKCGGRRKCSGQGRCKKRKR